MPRLLSHLLYLTGNLRTALGPYAYSLADFLAGPVWAASLVTAAIGMRERIGDTARMRMNLALLAAALAAGAFVLLTCVRVANRQYHLIHPELHLESSTAVLVVWTTLVAGITGAGWHILGWALALAGWSGWSSRRMPRGLCLLFLAAAAVSFFVYVYPSLEGAAGAFCVICALWQGGLLVKAEPPAIQAVE